jgi:hypothetical protein
VVSKAQLLLPSILPLWIATLVSRIVTRKTSHFDAQEWHACYQ